MQLPDGFPVDFPAAPQASVLGRGEISNGLSHVRWDVGVDHGTFIEDFAKVLDDAGWQVLTKNSSGRVFSLTCRSRARPEISCRILVTIEAVREPNDQYYRDVADIWVGSGAEEAR
jgi:hypothetical protein